MDKKTTLENYKKLLNKKTMSLALAGAISLSSLNYAETDTVEKFPDLDINYYTYSQIYKLNAEGIVGGYSDGYFKAENFLSRAEYITMIVKLLDLPISQNACVFTDMDSSKWAIPYVQTAYEAGIVNGSNGKFNPSSNVTRGDAITIAVNAIEDKVGSMPLGDAPTDLDSAKSYQKSALEKAYTAELAFKYWGNVFKPNDDIRRGDCAGLLYNTYVRIYGKEIDMPLVKTLK